MPFRLSHLGRRALAARLELHRSAWAYQASVSAGALLVGWILVQLAVLQRYFFLQPVLATAGLAVVVLAWWAHGVSSPRR